MENRATTLSDARERIYTQSIGIALTGVAVIAVSLFLIYILKLNLTGSQRQFALITMSLAALAGVCLIVLAAQRVVKIRNIATITFPCPYCDKPNQLLTTPTTDFDCEHCDRTIWFANGVMIPVVTISCPNCGTEGRVSEKTERYLCDNCNTNVRLKGEEVYGMTAGTQAPAPSLAPRAVALGGRFDVLLVGMDSTREGQIAAQLKELLELTDIPEARRLLATITERTPLIIGLDMPAEEAESVRNQLTNLGAILSLRPGAH